MSDVIFLIIMKSAPAPLFNYRKRQCHAILSDPQQMTTAPSSSQLTLHDSASGHTRRYHISEGLPHSSSVNQHISPVSNSQGNNWLGPIASANNGQKLVPNVTDNNKPSLMNMQGKFGASNTWSKSNMDKQRGSLSSTSECPALHFTKAAVPGRNTSSRKLSMSLTTPSSFPQRFTKTAASSITYNKNVQSEKMSHASSSVNIHDERRNGAFYGKTGRVNIEHSTITANSRNNTRMMDISVSSRNHQRKQCTSYQNTHFGSSDHWKNATDTSLDKTESGYKVDYVYGNEFSGQKKAGGCQVPIVRQAMQTSVTCVTAEPSLQIFTCSLATVMSWRARNIHAGLIMFEVYGVIDSAVVRDCSGTGKEFVLRDDTSNITCVFYEIDRELPRLIRGQVCRVVGSLSDRLNMLQAMSVRAAQMEERQVCQAATKLSLAEMEMEHHEQ